LFTAQRLGRQESELYYFFTYFFGDSLAANQAITYFPGVKLKLLANQSFKYDYEHMG